jgi:hypothetical protein
VVPAVCKPSAPELARRIQSLEQGLSWYEYSLQLTEIQARGLSQPPQVVVPRSNLEMESHCPWPAFHNLLHHVPEFDIHVRALGRGHDHEAAAERLGMRRLNAIPHFLGRYGFAEE